MTEISTLGEFGLIDRLTDDLPRANNTTKYAVGDDAAVLGYGERDVLVTTDLLLEGVHFDLTYVPLKHLRFTVEHIDELYAGIRLACERYGTDIVGGDTTASRQGLVISITCIGDVEKDKAILRSGARVNDLICVSGNLGAAYMGLQLLEREKAVSKGMKDFQPDFAGKEYIIERQLKPEPRVDIVKELREAGIQPTSMMDVSDGLSSELLHICRRSKVGCRIYEERIPIEYQTAAMAEELNMNLVTAALNGGEDYELLFTVPLHDKDRVAALRDVHVIGYICDADKGCAMITRDGESEIPLKAQGFNPLK